MNTILVIDSAVSGEASVSRALVREAVAALSRAEPSEVIYRDLGRAPVPHLTEATLAGVRGTPATEPESATRALSDTLIAELRAADTIVIGAPMYNFSVPTTLRSWFDHVLRAGVTFKYTETGPQGLLTGKRAYILTARGGIHAGATSDHQEPYLRQVMAFIGIHDVTFIHAEGLNMGGDFHEKGLNQAKAQLAAVA